MWPDSVQLVSFTLKHPVDGVQMGCRVQDDKSEFQDEYFNEEVVKDTIVEGIESKDRTFLKKKKSGILLVISSKTKVISEPFQKLFIVLQVWNWTRSVLNLLNRIYSENKYLPECYVIFLHENQYLSYQCHISVTNKHMENSWDI